MHFVLKCLHKAPYKFRQGLAAVLTFLWFDFLRIRRKVILENISKAFPDWPMAKKVHVGRTSLYHWALTFVEYCHFPWLTKAWVEKNVDFVNRHYIDEVVKEGKGAVMITLHMGNGDLACAALALSGYPVSVVSKTFKWKALNDFWFGLRERLGTELIPPRDATFAVLRSIKKGRIVIFPLDQYTGRPIGIRSTFFGITTGTAMGPVIMADRAECPALLCYTTRLPNGRHQIVFDGIDHVNIQAPKNSEARDKAILQQIQKWNGDIERWVRQHPEQWMWLHRRWKHFT